MKHLCKCGGMVFSSVLPLTYVLADSVYPISILLCGSRCLVTEARVRVMKFGTLPGAAAASGNTSVPGACAHPPCSTIVWPWCNVEYPISNFAAMWPTDEVGTFQVRAPIGSWFLQTLYFC